jgi:hypothetical protein
MCGTLGYPNWGFVHSTSHHEPTSTLVFLRNTNVPYHTSSGDCVSYVGSVYVVPYVSLICLAERGRPNIAVLDHPLKQVALQGLYTSSTAALRACASWSALLLGHKKAGLLWLCRTWDGSPQVPQVSPRTQRQLCVPQHDAL